MKKLFLGTLVLLSVCGQAYAAPDFKGYKAFLKENSEKIRTMEKECRDSKKSKERHQKCNDLMQFRVESECRFGINPDACKAIDEIKKMEKSKK